MATTQPPPSEVQTEIQELKRRIRIMENDKKMNEKNDNLLIKIENYIKKYIDRRLEIFILPKKDGNKLRLTNAPKK